MSTTRITYSKIREQLHDYVKRVEAWLDVVDHGGETESKAYTAMQDAMYELPACIRQRLIVKN